MNKKYIDYEDQNVANTIVYAQADGKHLCKDPKFAQAMTKDEVTNLWIKGMIIMCENKYYKPIHMKDNGSGVSIVSHDGSAAKTFNSSEVSVG